MPDMAGLTPKQNQAVKENTHLLDAYLAAIEVRVNAERVEREARHAVLQNGYVIAGVQ